MIRIGTSGWSYDHWADVLYPPGLPVAKRLARYVEEFDTVELNASFYRWPKDATFAGWRGAAARGLHHVGEGAPRADALPAAGSPEPWVERFERCWTALGDRREALLVQLHPAMERDDERLEHFLSVMPDWIPVAMELRHPSWDDPAVYDMLERHHAAYVVMSGAGLACVPRATSDLVYIRMHGPPRTRCTQARTPTTSCASGPTGSPNGTQRAGGCSSTSTTTSAATPSATPESSRSCWRPVG